MKDTFSTLLSLVSENVPGIFSPKQSSALSLMLSTGVLVARDLVYNFGAKTDLLDQGVQEVKAKLEELLRANLEHARATNVVYADMTAQQREEFRARFDSEADFQMAAKELRDRRAEEETRAIREHGEETRRVFGSMEKDAEQAHKKVGDSAEDGFGKASDSAKNAGDTIATELGGALNELDGTAEGAANGVVGALSGLSALIPGIGAALGAVFATVATPLIRTFFDSADESEARVDKLYSYLLDSEANYLSKSALQRAAADALEDPAMVNRAEAVAAAFNIPFATAMAVLVENGDRAKEMLAEVEERFASSAGGARGIGSDVTTEWIAARDALQETAGEFGTAVDRVQTLRGVLAELPGGVNETTDAAIEANLQLDRLANPRTARIELEVDTGPAEVAIERLRTRAARDLTSEFYITQNGKVIR